MRLQTHVPQAQHMFPRRHVSPDGLRAEAPAPSSGECRRRPDNLASPEKVLGPSPGPRHPTPGLALAGTLAGPTHTRLSRPSPPRGRAACPLRQAAVPVCPRARSPAHRPVQTPAVASGPPGAASMPGQPSTTQSSGRGRRHSRRVMKGLFPSRTAPCLQGPRCAGGTGFPPAPGGDRQHVAENRQQGPGLGWTGASGEAG